MLQQPATSPLEATQMPVGAVLVAASEDPRLLALLDALAADLALPFKSGKGAAELSGTLGAFDDHLLVLDWRRSGAGAATVAAWLVENQYQLPHVAIVPPGAVAVAVEALRGGACDAIELSLSDAHRADGGHADGADLVEARTVRARVGAAFALAAVPRRAAVRDRMVLAELRSRYAALRPVERTTMASMLAGTLNKQVAQELRIAERTVKKHRATVLKQMGAKSIADLVRMAIRLQLA